MTARKKSAEFILYQIPNGEDVLALLGSTWIRQYGIDSKGQVIEKNHFHNLLEIGICRWGKGTVVINNESRIYSEGTVAIIPRNIPHNIVDELGEKSFWEYIYINPAVFLKTQYGLEKRDIERYVGKIESRPVVRQIDEINLFSRELDCLMDQIRTQDYGYRNCVKGLLYTLLMEIIKIAHEGQDQIQPMQNTRYGKAEKIKLAFEFIEEHYCENITASDIAEAAYISGSYLSRIFAENYNMSPMQYVNFVRIDAACKLLSKKDLNISEAARKVGFENMSTFIKNFKRFVGKTPKQWLKEAMENENWNVSYKVLQNTCAKTK